MARVRCKDTTPELVLRRALHARGHRYRVHLRSVPGRPDLAFPSARVAVFVDGDFWHGRDLASWADKLPPKWRAKITRNVERDAEVELELESAGWRVVRVWAKDLRKGLDAAVAAVEDALGERGHERGCYSESVDPKSSVL